MRQGRIREACGLHENTVEPFRSLHQPTENADQIAPHVAADAAQRRHHHPALIDANEFVIDPDVAELVHHNGGVRHLRIAQKIVDKRRLSSAEEAGQNGDGDRLHNRDVILQHCAQDAQRPVSSIVVASIWNPSAVLHTGSFDFEKAHRHPLWFKELNGFKDHVPETLEYGVRSFVYRSRRPFHPARFQQFCNESWPGVIRTKGFFWLATRPHFVGEIAHAGAMVRTSKRGLWWSAVPKNRWPDQPGWYESMKPYFDPIWGDRRQEIVFIGTYPMDEAALRRRLDACLVGDPGHFTPDAWRHLPDPFPAWIAGAI